MKLFLFVFHPIIIWISNEATRGHSRTIRGHSRAIRGHSRPFEAIRGHFMTVSGWGHLRPFIGLKWPRMTSNFCNGLKWPHWPEQILGAKIQIYLIAKSLKNSRFWIFRKLLRLQKDREAEECLYPQDFFFLEFLCDICPSFLRGLKGVYFKNEWRKSVLL